MGCFFACIPRTERERCVHLTAERKRHIGRTTAIPVFTQVWSEKFWHITHLKEQAFRVTITKTFWFGTALEFLPIEKANEIYTLAVTMNAEEIRAAFHAGVKLGVQLMLEVEQEDG